MGPIIIAVIGCPGVGKTFLAEKLANTLGAVALFEEDGGLPPRILENLNKEIRNLETFFWFYNKQIEMMERAHSLKRKHCDHGHISTY